MPLASDWDSYRLYSNKFSRNVGYFSCQSCVDICMFSPPLFFGSNASCKPFPAREGQDQSCRTLEHTFRFSIFYWDINHVTQRHGEHQEYGSKRACTDPRPTRHRQAPPRRRLRQQDTLCRGSCGRLPATRTFCAHHRCLPRTRPLPRSPRHRVVGLRSGGGENKRKSEGEKWNVFHQTCCNQSTWMKDGGICDLRWHAMLL